MPTSSFGEDIVQKKNGLDKNIIMKNYSLLNSFLVAILCLSIMFNAFGIIASFGKTEYDVFSQVELFLALASIAGSLLILRLNKWGYWIMVGARILIIVVGIIQVNTLEKKGFVIPDSAISGLVIRNLSQIVFLSLLMLLRKDGKSAYQVLWNKMPFEEVHS